MSNTLLVVLGGLGGVTLTALAGLFGAWIQGRREHSRWIRESRYEAYSEYLAAMELIQNYSPALRGKPSRETVDAHISRLSESMARFDLLGPQSLHVLADEYAAFMTDALDESDVEVFKAKREVAKKPLLDAMAKALRVPI